MRENAWKALRLPNLKARTPAGVGVQDGQGLEVIRCLPSSTTG